MEHYKTYLVMFLVSAVGSFALTPVAMRIAHRIGAVDIPSPRKIHKVPMPRLGGLAVFLGFFLPWGGLYLLHNHIALAFQNYEILFLALAIGTSCMLALGTFDDIRGADAVQKFLVQIAVACLLWSAGFRISSFSSPFGSPIPLHPALSLPITVLWIVGVTNAINLLDGIDGLVAGVAAVIGLSLAIINIISQNPILALLTIALTGASLGFLPYNYSPARIFLGDSGSLTIGMVLSCIGVLSVFGEPGKSGANPLITVPLILFGLPLFDTFRVMVKRFLAGTPIFQADKNHVHHQLLKMGLSQKQAAWTLYSVAALTGMMAVILTTQPTDRQFVLSAFFALLSVVAYSLWRYAQRQVDPDA